MLDGGKEPDEPGGGMVPEVSRLGPAGEGDLRLGNDEAVNVRVGLGQVSSQDLRKGGGRVRRYR